MRYRKTQEKTQGEKLKNPVETNIIRNKKYWAKSSTIIISSSGPLIS